MKREIKKEENYQLQVSVIEALKEIDKQEKELKARKESIRESILKEMEEKNILKIDTDELSITYKAPTEKETFSTKKFKEDLPDLYDTYVEFTPVKSSLLIKFK